MERKTETYVDPPAYAKATNKVSNKYSKETVYGPVVRDAHVTEVVDGEDKLVPEQTKADGTGDEPATLVRIRGGSSQEEVSGDLWSIASEIAGLVETGIDDALVKLLVGSGMAGLYFERQIGGGWVEGGEGGSGWVLEQGIVFGDEKDFRRQARRG